MPPLLAWLLLASGCGHGCSSTPLRASAAGSAPAAATDGAFFAPGPDGWGSAAGLRYLEVVPRGAPEQALPMLLLLHGLGDRPRPGWLDPIHIDAPVRIVMPQAPTPWHEGFSWFDYRVRDNEPAALARGIAGAAEQLARALSLLRARRPTRGLPMVAGFSQGGMLTYALALRHPELISLAVPISGMLPAPLWPTRRLTGAARVPIRALHGTADDVVPFEPTRQLVAQLQRLGYDVQLTVFAGAGHAVTAPMQPLIRETLTAGARALATTP